MSAGADCVVVRPMTAADLDQILEIAAPPAPRWSRGIYGDMLEPANAGQRIALVAEEVESVKAVGFAIASLVPPEAELESIGVTAEFQKRGIGGRLVGEMEKNLRLRGVTKVHLEVRDSNLAAKRLYASLGFIETGRRSGYYTDSIEDAITMRLDMTRDEAGTEKKNTSLPPRFIAS
jgi:[ribosomal protein S18]-alanine N-acetyltransferase